MCELVTGVQTCALPIWRMSADDAERAAKELDLGIGAINSWTRAIDRAAAQNQPATVMLLAAVGMQGSDWRAVPPENLYHIVAAQIGRASCRERVCQSV